MDYVQRHRYEGYARTLADTAGLTIKFHDKEIQPHTTGKSLHVQAPSYDWTDGQWQQWYYYLLHEIGHQREPWDEWTQVHKKYGVNRSNILGRLYNLNSDQAQEHDHYGRYRGIDLILGEQRSEFVKRITEAFEPKDEEEAAWQACWQYDAMCRQVWNPNMVGTVDKLPLHEDALPYLEKLVKWGESAQDCTNEWETYDFTKRMLDALGLDSEKLEEEMQANGQQQGGDASDGGDSSDSEGDGQSSSEAGEGEGVSKWVKYDPYFQHNHEAGVGYADMTIDYDDYQPQGGGFSKREMLVVDFQKKQFPVDLTESRQFSALKSSSGFSNQVRKLLQVMSATRYQGGQRKGKLNSRSLWKCKTNDPHIFKQKVENLNLKSTAVSLLVDFSGSMGGDKIDHAVSACLMLNDAIAKLQIPVEIEGFTDDSRPVQYIIKKFDERLTEDEIKRRMSMCASYMGSNSDAESLLHSYGRLLQRTEKKKVLIVLSDGQPASSGYGCDVTMLREVVKQIGNGPVKLYGIGIMSDAVENYYPNRTVLKSASDLESCLLDVVKKQIVTGE